jgi:hypothetical protein
VLIASCCARCRIPTRTAWRWCGKSTTARGCRTSESRR